jgi:GntR family transcriptional regulator/MocR family aminotransferase
MALGGETNRFIKHFRRKVSDGQVDEDHSGHGYSLSLHAKEILDRRHHPVVILNNLLVQTVEPFSYDSLYHWPGLSMAKRATPFELTLGEKPRQINLTRWLYGQLRQAILDGRLKPAARLPASRDFAAHYKISRGTVVSVFEQLHSEGFLNCRVGFGTWVNKLPDNTHRFRKLLPAVAKLPSPLTGLSFPHPAQPFRSHEPAVNEFPVGIWARIASRRIRRASTSLLRQRDSRGHAALRNALAAYLGVSRGVNCSADQIVIVTGAQQALDILARVLLKPGDPVWMEDPGYFGAVAAFHNAGMKIVPVPIDDQGISVAAGKRHAPRAKGVYVTPAHQFPLGVMMSPERRLEVLSWASEAGAFVIEDDYDGEFRLDGHPVSVLQNLDKNENVILVGSFNKLLFSALRVGYMVLPQRLIDTVLAFRFGIDQNAVGLEQSILADFIDEGHMGRHMRRMRELYSNRLRILRAESDKKLKGLLAIPNVKAGLYAVGFLSNRMSSRQAESAAASHGIETMAVDRFVLSETDPRGILLGFAAFDERTIKRGVASLAMALSK